ncbi:hypothetical protein RRG08_050671, partial [Elysia crispata]
TLKDLEDRSIVSFKKNIAVNNVNQKGQLFFELHGPGMKNTKSYLMKHYVLRKHGLGKKQRSQKVSM